MPYNAKQIDSFIDRVNEEAEKAAQKVFDGYEAELKRRILAQLKPGDALQIGMGTARIVNTKGDCIANALAVSISQCQYTRQNAGFYPGDLLKE